MKTDFFRTGRFWGVGLVLAVAVSAAAGDLPRQARLLIDHGVWSEAVSLLRDHMADAPDDVSSRHDLAQTLFRLHRFDEAVEEVLAIPVDHPVYGPRRRYLLMRLRLELARSLDWSRAGEVLEFARICARMESYERSIQAYRRLLAIEPRLAWRRELAAVLAWASRYDEAARQWERCLAEQPDDVSARHELARVTMAQGRLQTALRQLEETVRRDPNHLAARLDRIRVLIWLDRMAEAERLLDELLAGEPEGIEARLLAASLQLRRNRVEGAYALLQSVAAAAPDDPRAARMIRDLDRSRRVELAVLRRRLAADPAGEPDRIRLIDLLLETGRPGAALVEMDVLSRLRPDDLALRQRVVRLRERQRQEVLEGLRRHVWDETPPAEAWLERHPDDQRATRRLPLAQRTVPDAGRPIP